MKTELDIVKHKTRQCLYFGFLKSKKIPHLFIYFVHIQKTSHGLSTTGLSDITPYLKSYIHHPDIHHLRHSSPIVVESDIHHPGHSSPQMFITSDFHHLSIHHPLGKIRHSSPQDLLHFCIVLYLLINFHIFKNMFTFSENQPWAEPNCMLWRKMTFTMMEKDQDMAKITLEEEVNNGKKIQIGKIIKFEKIKV